jgi:hypothetical protein
MIRLLHDPAFAAAVYADPERTLGDVELTSKERAWLTAEPAAAWRTDPARPARVLAALAEEYPATCALACDRVPSFFASRDFHAAVQERGSLALAFGDHLMRSADPRVSVLARLERAIAAVRRAPERPTAAAGALLLRLSPRASVLRVPEGALGLLATLRSGKPPGPLRSEDEPVLVFAPPDGGEVTLEALPPALAALLERATPGVAYIELLAEARRLGAALGEDTEIVAGLVADALLVGAAGSAV